MLNSFAAETIHVSLPAEAIFHIGSLPISNSMIMLMLTTSILLLTFFSTARAFKAGKPNRLHLAIHWLFEILLNTVEQVAGSREKGRRIAPLAITMFFVVLFGYYGGILPVVGAVTYNETELFRGGVADLNFTFALAVISMVAVQLFAIRQFGLYGNIKRYLVNPLKNPAGSFEGFLELIAEFSRGIALSFRLFGNVFAGEVLLLVIAFLTGYLTPIVQPFFLAFELFIGAIQAYVFFMLTVVFISLGSSSHGSHPDEDKHDKPAKPVAATV